MGLNSQLDKLTDFVGFKAHPDETISSYTLPIGKKAVKSLTNAGFGSKS